MKIVKPILITVATIAVLVVLAAVIAPPVAKRYIVNHSKGMVGRQINLRGLYANVFTGYTRLTGFELLDTNDRDRFVAFDTLVVKVSLFRLLANELRINRIRLVNPDIQVWQKGEMFNFSDLLQAPDATQDTTVINAEAVTTASNTPADTRQDSATSVAASTDTPMAIALNNISIVGGHIAYNDRLVGSEWHLNDLQLEIPGVYFSGQNTDIGLNLNFREGGSLHTSMQYNLEAGAYTLRLQLNDFAIDNTLPYLQQSLNVNQVKGLLSADLYLAGNTAHALDITVKGTTALRQFRLTDAADQDIFAAGEFAVDIAAINPEKQQFRFNTLSLKDFSSRFDLYKESNTFSRLLKDAGADTTAKAETGITREDNAPARNTGPAPDFFIGNLSVDNAAFVYNDHTLHEPFRFNLGNIRMSAHNLTLNGKNRVDIKSTLDNGGTISLTWNGQPDDPSNQTINLQIKNLDLKQFTPYSLQYFGYPMTQGVLAFSSINDIRNNNLDGRNKLDIYRCEVDKKRKDPKPEFNIPLRTALYIIKDMNDHIKMDLPVKGNIQSPSFSYKKIIIRTLSNLLLKVAVSPFSFLANSLGLSYHELKDIPFEVYQSDFTPEQFDRINQLTAVLKAKPEMTLALQQYYNPAQGEQTLALFQAQKSYYLQTHPEVSDSTLQAIDYVRITEISPKDPAFAAYVASRVAPELQSADLNTQLLSLTPPETLQSQVAMLARLRDQKLKSYLLHQGLDEKNIRLGSVSADSLANYSGKNRYTFQLTFGDEELPETTADDPGTTTEEP